jgi:hypothetical protein
MKTNFIHIMAGIIAILCFLGGGLGFSPSYWFAIVTLLLLLYLGYEIYYCAVNEAGKRWLVNPAILTSINMFGVIYGVANILYYTSTGEEDMDMFGINYQWLSRAEALALLGAVSMWLGYRSQFSVRMARWLSELCRFDVVLIREWKLNWSIVWFFVLTSVGCRLAMIYLGLYGYNADLDALLAYQSYTQYFLMVGQLGSLALLALVLHCAGVKQPSVLAWECLYGVFLCEMFFGLLAGFKALVVMPSLIIAIGNYTVKGKVPLVWLGAALLSLGLAFFLVEPLRAARHHSEEYDNRSLLSISAALVETLDANDTEIQRKDSSGILYHLLRTNLTGFSAVALRFRETEEWNDDSPASLTNLLLAPVYAITPRFLWPDKPLSAVGRWFYEEVLQLGTGDTSVAMGPVGQLYLAGGATAVCFGFLVVGIIQRLVYQAFWRLNSGGSLLVYLAILGSIARFESGVDAVVITVIRSVPLLLVCQYFLFKRS